MELKERDGRRSKFLASFIQVLGCFMSNFYPFFNKTYLKIY